MDIIIKENLNKTGRGFRTDGDAEPLYESNGSNSSQCSLGWLADAWVCGTSDQLCRYCGQPLIFAPPCLALEACTCGGAAKVILSARGKPAARIGANRHTSAG
jgi:hypothetical protein